MYFPILRGKKFEFLALKNLINVINSKEEIIPIIEPINNYDKFIKECEKIKEIRFVVITNPLVGQLVGEYKNIKSNIVEKIYQNHNKCEVGFQITSSTTVNDVKNFINDFLNIKKYLIYHEVNKSILEFMYNNLTTEIINIFDISVYKYISQTTLIDKFTNENSVILHDGFKKESRNGDYPKESYFTDWVVKYKENNLLGYSDYTTIGNVYKEGGFIPYIVAIHYTIKNNDSLYVRHYLSYSNNNSRKDTANKFFEAAKLYKNDITQNRNINYKTLGGISILDDLSCNHFPGLGKLKQYSIEHHIELISSIE